MRAFTQIQSAIAKAKEAHAEADGGLTPEQLEMYERFMEIYANFY